MELANRRFRSDFLVRSRGALEGNKIPVNGDKL